MIDGLDIGISAVFGLLVGSFLNVVVWRLPKMMERQERYYCAQVLDLPEAQQTQPVFNVMVPRSHCPACGHQVRWWENIPVLSFLFLRARCSGCGVRISWRYPVVEIITGALFAYCVQRWGLTPEAGMWCLFCAVLLSLALIDWDTTYLPDVLTLPLLWAGLVGAALGWTGQSLNAAVWGAVGGYMSLWSVYWVFKLLTGKDGMGFGDFKLFAVLGVWFGWQALVPIILMASVIGAVVGLLMKVFNHLREGGYIPFGPFLAGAGFAVFFVGAEQLSQMFSQLMGL